MTSMNTTTYTETVHHDLLREIVDLTLVGMEAYDEGEITWKAYCENAILWERSDGLTSEACDQYRTDFPSDAAFHDEVIRCMSLVATMGPQEAILTLTDEWFWLDA